MAKPRVLLVGWDAADWKVMSPLIDDGLLPNVRRLVEGGVVANLASLEPMASPLLWTSIATGKRADEHGILSFAEPDPLSGGVRPASSTSRRVKALWNIATQSGLRSIVVGWYATHPAEPIAGSIVTDLYPVTPPGPEAPPPLPPGTVHPARLEAALAPLRFQACEIPPQALIDYVPRAALVDQESDRRLFLLARLLAKMQSVHNAATWLLEHEPWDLACVYYDAIDHACHHFMRFAPPRMDEVDEAEVELYGGVVTAIYRHHDLMLGRLIELAGPGTTVVLCSDHGFRSGPHRPAHAAGRGAETMLAWHRRHGVLVLHGPGIAVDERIHGAGLLDLAPTVLAALGLPVARDMEGRVLVEAFAEPPAPARIDSWEALPGDAGRHPQEVEDDPWEAREALRQLVELGYVDAVGENKEKAVRSAEQQRRYLLARLLLDRRRNREALEPLEELVREAPSDDRFVFLLARAKHRLGLREEARALFEGLRERHGDRPGADISLGMMAFFEGQEEEALAHLERAEASAAERPAALERIGRIYLHQRRPADAERALRAAIAQDGERGPAHEALAIALIYQGRYEEAAEAALEAVGLDFQAARAHFALGLALARLDREGRALQAFEAAARIEPRWPAPHRLLASIYARLGRAEDAARESRLGDAALAQLRAGRAVGAAREADPAASEA